MPKTILSEFSPCKGLLVPAAVQEKHACDLVAPLPFRSPFWHHERKRSPGSRLCVCFSPRVSRFSSFLCQRHGGADVDGARWNNGLPGERFVEPKLLEWLRVAPWRDNRDRLFLECGRLDCCVYTEDGEGSGRLKGGVAPAPDPVLKMLGGLLRPMFLIGLDPALQGWWLSRLDVSSAPTSGPTTSAPLLRRWRLVLGSCGLAVMVGCSSLNGRILLCVMLLVCVPTLYRDVLSIQVMYACYMLIQILQSKGQLLTSGARPAHSVPNRDACGGCGGRQPPRYGSLLPPIYILLVSRRLGLIAS
jgi:hypothetical protein